MKQFLDAKSKAGLNGLGVGLVKYLNNAKDGPM